MISRFVRRFKSTDQDELRALQGRVASALKELYPEKQVVPSADPLQIEFDGRACGLTNIRSAFLLSSQTDDDFRNIVIDHFRILVASEDLLVKDELEWASAQGKLMPQLMPDEFLKKVPLAHLAFGHNVVLAFVVDTDQAYRYVSETDVDRWKIDQARLTEVALENLRERSRGVEATAFERPNGFVVINTLDGFDAVRIVSPGIQEFVSEIIGKPFRFGVPNRDFLICWELNDDPDFQSRFVGQISQDFAERPYPLSPHVFEVTQDGQIRQIENEKTDPRADAAEYN